MLTALVKIGKTLQSEVGDSEEGRLVVVCDAIDIVRKTLKQIG